MNYEEREKRLLAGCSCVGFHTHSHGVCNTCKNPVIDWIDAHETAVEDFSRQTWRVELIKAVDDAIAAQERIIANDGALQAHVMSLHALKAEKAKLFSTDWLDGVNDVPSNAQVTGRASGPVD